MFENFKSALGFGGGKGKHLRDDDGRGAFHSGSHEIESGSYHGRIKTHEGIYRDQNDALHEARELTAARVATTVYNSQLNGVIDAAVGSIIGTGLKPNVAPLSELIGFTEKEANSWSRKVEQLFSLWAENPREVDALGRQTFGQMQRTALRGYFVSGEMIAAYPTLKELGNIFSSKVALLDQHRLAHDSPFDKTEIYGLKFDGGRPIGIRIRDKDPVSGVEDLTPRIVPFFSKSGRPLSSLIIDHIAPNQHRGISPVMSCLASQLQLNKLMDTSLDTAILQSQVAAVIESNETPEDVRELFDGGDEGDSKFASHIKTKNNYYKNSYLNRLDSVLHTFPGEKLEFKSTELEATNLRDFARQLNLEIARALGVPYTVATGDYSDATFSSVRMETAVNWPLVLQRRKLVAKFCQLAFESWLENAILSGLVQVPGGYQNFLALRPAFCRTDWRGPAMPQADELKSARAAQIRLKTGYTSLSAESEALGYDYQDVLLQRKREKEFAAQLGLPDPHVDDPATVVEPVSEARPIADGTARLTYSEGVAQLEELEAVSPNKFIPQHSDSNTPSQKAMITLRAKERKDDHFARIKNLEDQIEGYQS